MSVESELAALTTQTTALLDAVNTKKSALDTAVSTAESKATIATTQANIAVVYSSYSKYLAANLLGAL